MSDHPVKRRKKLIEVAIPLEAINAASAREKSIRHGHPSTLHLWWARRPLAAARAVIFCQMVDDPSAVPEEFATEEAQENERLRLFALISELVTWENTSNEQVLNRAREEIRRSWRRCCADNADHPEAAELFNPEKLPGFHDPFAGGGALPLEAQRLGLEAYASDLNPVAVLINKAMIEIPPKFAGMPPVNPEARSKKQLIERQWKGAEGLAEDVCYYGRLARDKAKKRLSSAYPDIYITEELADRLSPTIGQIGRYARRSLNIVAWIWVRTVRSPNPAFTHVDVPLASSFIVSSRKNAGAFVTPCIDKDGWHFVVHSGRPENYEELKKGTKTGRGANFKCIMSGDVITSEYIKSEGLSGRLGQKLMCIVAEGDRERLYLPPDDFSEKIALEISPEWAPQSRLPEDPRNFWTPLYGLSEYKDLFTSRQLYGLHEIIKEIESASELVAAHALDAYSTGSSGEHEPISESLAQDYASAVKVYLSFALSKLIDRSCSLVTWFAERDSTYHLFARQAIPMSWDFAETNILLEGSGSYLNAVQWVAEVVSTLAGYGNGRVFQHDAATQSLSLGKVVSTDPPYYDNIDYANLSDFFYVWLRRLNGDAYPQLFATLSTPKSSELVANPYRHGGSEKAESFFLSGMKTALSQIAQFSHPVFPVSIYYAFRQAELKADGRVSTGWETFLSALISAGLSVIGTWPVRTELSNRAIARGANALASSVVLICRPRLRDAAPLSRQEFRRRIRQELPAAMANLERANIAPVDIAQAAIGPGMAIFSSARVVLNPDDSPMSVRDALIEINTALDEYLSQDEGELDSDSRFALTFFESFGYQERDFGDAEGLAKARNVSVEGVAKAGILRSIAGKAWLLRRGDLEDHWDPTTDKRLCAWEATQQLIKRLETSGEEAAGKLLAQLNQVSGHGDLGASCRALAYRLYNHCEKTKQIEEARSYNGLVIAWPQLERQASAASSAQSAPLQTSLI